MAHDRNCRFSPLFPHCNCGEDERNAKIEALEVRIRELEAEVSKLSTCDSCEDPAARHVCRHHCYRQ